MEKKSHEFFIPGRLPGLNEMIGAAKRGRGKQNAYAREKKAIEQYIISTIHAEKIPFFHRCKIGFTWIEPNRRRDIDNISVGKKYILDALVKAGVLHDDNWNHVKGFLDENFLCDKKKPGVMVRIEEV